MMRTQYAVIISIMLFAVLTGCHKEDTLVKEPKVIETLPEILATQAVFEWTVDYPGKISSVLEISYFGDMSNATRYGSEVATTEKDFKVTVTGLNEATQYYYRYVVWNPSIQYEMEVKRFTTKTITKPTVVSSAVIGISVSSAICGGEVTDDGCDEVTERGICWGISPNPDITGTHASSGAGLGVFTVEMTGLIEGTVYYVRAYAVNCKGTSYGSEKQFYPHQPGILKGQFSVNEDIQVCFSQGNLWYQASTNTWRFAELQYDFIGGDNNNISSTNSGWIDLFGWGTSGWVNGAHQPWSTSTEPIDYFVGGAYSNSMTGNYANADWGVYNAISNGGNQTGMWRTLKVDEWDYLLNTRETSSGVRYVKACVNNVNGLILLPDDWNNNYYSLNNPNDSNTSCSDNVITESQWSTLEVYGVIFLPAAGYRKGTETYGAGSYGSYWSATSDQYYMVNNVCFNESESYSDLIFYDYRYTGLSVRLVRTIE